MCTSHCSKPIDVRVGCPFSVNSKRLGRLESASNLETRGGPLCRICGKGNDHGLPRRRCGCGCWGANSASCLWKRFYCQSGPVVQCISGHSVHWISIAGTSLLWNMALPKLERCCSEQMLPKVGARVYWQSVYPSARMAGVSIQRRGQISQRKVHRRRPDICHVSARKLRLEIHCILD